MCVDHVCSCISMRKWRHCDSEHAQRVEMKGRRRVLSALFSSPMPTACPPSRLKVVGVGSPSTSPAPKRAPIPSALSIPPFSRTPSSLRPPPPPHRPAHTNAHIGRPHSAANTASTAARSRGGLQPHCLCGQPRRSAHPPPPTARRRARRMTGPHRSLLRRCMCPSPQARRVARRRCCHGCCCCRRCHRRRYCHRRGSWCCHSRGGRVRHCRRDLQNPGHL